MTESQREIELLGLWIVESCDLDPPGAEVVELEFALRTPTWGGRVDGCELDLVGHDARGEQVWPARASSTGSALLSSIARNNDADALEVAAAELVHAALERLDASSVLGERAVTIRVGRWTWPYPDDE